MLHSVEWQVTLCDPDSRPTYVPVAVRLVANGYTPFTFPFTQNNKKSSYRQGTARCVVSVEILPIATQQCRNYLFDKS